MATSGLYGNTAANVTALPSGSETSGLYGNNTVFGGTYFEWFVFQTANLQPATPTGGSWDFTTNTGTAPTGWSSTVPTNPTATVWVSIALVNSRTASTLTWSVPGKFAYSSGLPVLSGTGAPSSGLGVTDQMYIQTDTTPESIWFSQVGVWTKLTGSTLYTDLTSNQTIAGTKTFASQIQGSISGNAGNVTGTVAIANGGTGQTTANAAFNALVPSQAGNNGKFLTTDGSNTSWSANPLGTVTSVAATVPAFLSISGSPITTSGTLAITYSGTALPVANGGTGVTASSGANSVVLRDASANISANSISEGYSNVAAAGTTTVLTAASVPNYVVTGSGGQTYQLPDATTLVSGVNYTFNNNQSSGTIVVKNNSSTTIATIQSGGFVDISLLSNAIAAGSWDVHNFAPSNVSWSTNTFDYAGSITSATWNGATVAVNRGGTGVTTSTGTGSVVLSTSPTLVTPALGTPSALVGTNITGTASGLSIGGNAATATTATNVSGGTSSVTSETVSGNFTLSGGTANGVAYLNGSKVLTTGSALTFDGATFYGANGKFGNGVAANTSKLMVNTVSGTAAGIQLFQDGVESWIMGMPASSSGLAWSNSGTEQMRLTSTGLGIGTSSPAQKLHLNVASGAVFEQITSGSNSVYLGWDSTNSVGTFQSNTALTFATGASYTERMRLDSSGNLGLGVTPSAWQSDSRALDIGAYTSLSNVLGYQATIANNAYYNAGYKYRTSGYVASAFAQANGAFYWQQTSTSGTAGNAISFTQAMTLDASGNLLVGLTSALANGKIQVAGSIGLSGNTQIRQATNSDGNTLQFFGTQFVASTTNSGSYSYSGGGLVAPISPGDGTLLIDAGFATSTYGRFKVANTVNPNVAMSLEKNGVYTLYADTGSGSLGIGAAANASAILDAQSTTKGVRMPNMTTTQKNAIASPAAGLMVFDTTLAKLCVYTGSAWQTITSI